MATNFDYELSHFGNIWEIRAISLPVTLDTSVPTESLVATFFSEDEAMTAWEQVTEAAF
jgi:hypothetical protein